MAEDDCGFLFAISGPKRYALAANQAARSLRAACPGIAVDIYTDLKVDQSLFARVHGLEKSWYRPKFEALLRSRFTRTVYLDADLVVLADISDIFEVLGQFDVAMAQAQNRNQPFARELWKNPVPNAFPQFNSGVMGVRRNAGTAKLLRDTIAALEGGARKDQPPLRELLYLSDLRVATLPPEYNSRDKALWLHGSSRLTAPRVLHSSKFATIAKTGRPPTPEDLYGRFFLGHAKRLARADRTLDPAATGYVPRPFDIGGWLGNFLGLKRD